jgi:hypothetical protein
VVLQTLAPTERLAFVLRDMFAVPFDEIAPIVSRSAPTQGSSPAAYAAGCTEQPRFRSAVLVLRMVGVTTGSSRATAATPR